MILPGGSTKEFAYDPLMRIKSITAKDPGQNVLLNYQYSHDKVDNITQKATEHGDYAYDYDDLYRLADVDNPDFDDEAFTYDGVGNRLTSEGVTGDWSYNTNNELAGYNDVSYVYDDNGNMVQKTVGGVVTNLAYNIENRLTEVRDGSNNLIASYYYDPFGRRLWKEVGGTRTYFHYADEGLIGEYDSTGNEIKTYGYKPNSIFTTDPLFMKVGTNYYFYHTDHLGTPQKMTDVNGAIVWAAKYSSFGKANVDVSSTITNNLRFAGQYEDEETGLHYNYHRYYDPGTGRYLKPDPLGLRGGLNLFQYALSNPIVKYDQYGLAVTTVDAFCRRYPKACRDLFPNRPVPVPPPILLEKDDTNETIEVPTDPKETPDFSNDPDACTTRYLICKAGCIERSCEKSDYLKCMLKTCLPRYLMCLLSNIL